ncbi:hypothetical protein [Rubripirellula reticaptiva]|uniref:Uncharacterized protein n=1 Tax=Rubripirellula reticaptiva TaxID=2528013 RepID=A0A5C6EDL1_9BACT|nr:hypothetical protein [Rubripirellula reticaptiva]TWU47803.1 hypothetical protein Poly59_46450 [Rubripirellula reticaptiva]
MQNPYRPFGSNVQGTVSAAISIPAVLFAPVATLAISLVLAAMAGLFIFIYWMLLFDRNEGSTILFNAIFFPAFVWPPFLLCGYLAGRLAGYRCIAHAFYAGCIYLVADVAMSVPWLVDAPYFWTHVMSCVLIVPLALLGGKLAERGRLYHPMADGTDFESLRSWSGRPPTI